MILNAAILNGALELLPQSLASMAIIPLQTRLVYRIGKLHGYELDKGHIADFLATVGVGLTSQYVEQFGRKLVGGLLGKVMGGLGRAVGSAATGSAFSFATTYALGKVAHRYYAGGRTLDNDTLKASFARTVEEARGLQQRYAPQIQQRARGLDVGKLLKGCGRLLAAAALPRAGAGLTDSLAARRTWPTCPPSNPRRSCSAPSRPGMAGRRPRAAGAGGGAPMAGSGVGGRAVAGTLAEASCALKREPTSRVWECLVHRAWQRTGLGRRLLRCARAHAAAGAWPPCLTTRADLPWNVAGLCRRLPPGS